MIKSACRHGSGSPALMLVHGGFCDHRDWSAQVDVLSRHYAVVTFDLPGHADEPLPAQPSVAALARAVCEVRAHDGLGPTILIAHSLGCRVVLESFRQSATGIIGLVLLDGDRLATGAADDVVHAIESRIAAVGFLDFVSPAYENSLGGRIDPRVRQRALARLQRIDPAFGRDLLLSTVRWDAQEAPAALKAVNVPLLALQSTYIDMSGNRRSIAYGSDIPWLQLIQQCNPSAELRLVPEAGHFLMIDAADVVNTAILDFARHVTH